MRVWCVSLLLSLMIILVLQSCVKGQSVDAPKTCCFNYRTKKMRVGNIMKYEQTASACPKPGVIFTTWEGNLVCGDPKVNWVKQAKKTIEKRRTEN